MQWHRSSSRLSLSCALTLSSLFAAAPARALSSPPPYACQHFAAPVSLAPGQLPSAAVSATLCARGPVTAGRTVQVLLSGNTYGSAYWDFPYRPEVYSYVRWMTDAGYVTLNIDRIGIGQSTRPPATSVDMATNAWVVEQVVAQLADGSLTGVPFSTIVLVGHSYGSAVGMLAASHSSAVDGLIVSGMLHTLSYGFLLNASAMAPAQLDPRFSGQNIPLGYLTTGLLGRNVFYWTPGAEPAAIDADEATKETMTLLEGSTQEGLDATASLAVPVLSVVGDYDATFCGVPTCGQPGSAAANEPAYYPPAAQLEVQVVADAGHSLNLHLVAPTWFAIAEEWLDRRFGPGGP
jgi:pimeloyl-ACP methyl ester carboxylesterase